MASPLHGRIGCLGLPRSATSRSRAPARAAAAAAAAAALLWGCGLGPLAGLAAGGPRLGPGRPQRHTGGRARRAAAAAEGGAAPEGKAFFNYLTNQWDFAREGTPLPWEEAASSFSDFLPWSEGDRAALALLEQKVPKWREGFLMPKDDAGVRRRFRVVAEVAGGDRQGLAALQRNIGILCVGERVTRAAAGALVAELGPEGAADVVRKNPGVLGIKASSLQGNRLKLTVATAGLIDFLVGPGKILVSAFQLFAATAVGKAVFDVVFLPNGLIRALPPQ